MQKKQIEAVQAAARILGSQAALARALGVTPVTVGQWLKPDLSTGRGVPPKQCVRIEQLTAGQVSRRDLRPDDWQDIWPELAETAQPIDIQPNQATALIPPAQVAINTVADTGDAAQAWGGAERRQMTEGV